jgi:hypothetical protein
MWIAAGDFTEQYFPLRAFTAQEWVRGHIPLWNPYLFGGQPALADIQSGALYPPHVIEALLLGWGGPLFGREIGFPLWALEHQVIFHFSLAAVGTYLFTRHSQLCVGMPLRQARFGGVIASLVFTYGGYLTGFPVQQMTILAVSAWLPWVLWGLNNTLFQILINCRATVARTSSFTFYALHFTPLLKPLAWTSLALTMAILAGHPQTALYIFYLTLAYTLFRAFDFRQKESLIRSVTYSLFIWLGIILLGAAISAAQLLPTLEFIAHSLRADPSYSAVSTGLPLTELIAILYPGFLGGSPQYVGIATLILIAFALTLGWAQFKAARRQKTEPANPPGDLEKFTLSPPRSIIQTPSLLFWAGAGLTSLLLAFGDHLFVYPLFYLLAPSFDLVRQQERAFLIYSFSAAMLAGYGAVAWFSPLPKLFRQSYRLFDRRLCLVAGVAVGLTIFYVYGSTAATARGDEVNLFFGVLQHHLFGLVILGGMLLLFRLRPRRWLRRKWGMVLMAGWLAFNLFTVNWRFNLEKPANTERFAPTGVIQFLQSHLSGSAGRIVSGGFLPGGNSAASVYNLQDLTGNTPLQLATVNRFIQEMTSWRLWQLLNVFYVVDRRDVGDAGLRPVFEADGLKIFEMNDPFERAWLVSNVEVITGEQQSMARLSADDFDLRRTAVVAAPLDGSLTDTSGSTVSLAHFEPTYLELEVDAGGPHLLVLSQIYYPGWRAELDAQPAKLLRVNQIQQGLVVPSGRHTIQIRFWPDSFVRGGIISITGLVFCLLALFWPKRPPQTGENGVPG